jgi:hypothetical protein
MAGGIDDVARRQAGCCLSDDDVPSGTVAALIEEATGAAQAANEAAELARVRAMDPALSAKELADARHAMEDAA